MYLTPRVALDKVPTQPCSINYVVYISSKRDEISQISRTLKHTTHYPRLVVYHDIKAQVDIQDNTGHTIFTGACG